MRTKEYTIKLPPIPWRRAGVRGVGNKVNFYDQQKNAKLLYGIYLSQQHGKEPLFTKALEVKVTFYFPLAYSKKERHKKWRSSKPDIDNLAGLTFDAINNCGAIWKDDSLVSSLIAKKMYDKEPRTHIVITELE